MLHFVATPETTAIMSGQLKEDLSRMEGTYGAETVGKLKAMNVLICGLRGLGIETAKNLVLAGPHSLTICDDVNVTKADLGANFYLRESDVGKPRAAAVLPRLQDLNPNVRVLLHSGGVSEDLLANQSVVVVCDDSITRSQLISMNNFCRSRPTPVAFLVGHLQGATCSIFTDFGPSHTVFDQDGEPVKTLIIDSILEGQEHGNVTIDGDRHLLDSGTHVKFEGVLGMSKAAKDSNQTFGQDDVITDINQTHVIKPTKNPKRFTIGNTTKLKKYKGGGVATEVKVPKTFNYKSFADSLTNPPIIMGYMDFTKFGRAEQLHIARLALYEFQEQNKALPALHNKEDAAKLVQIAKEILASHKKTNAEKPNTAIEVELEEKVINQCSLYCTAELTAIGSIFGGVLAQEIVKHTGKYTPIDQWFHFDAFELLSEEVPSDAKPCASRYDHQISIFGRKFQDKLMSQKIFVVGCGALGCEYMKAVAMSGLGTKGKVYVTDDDTIELSNLSRQFLFRRKHVGKSKAVSASTEVVEMNEDLKKSLKSYEIRVEPKTEDVFNDSYWDSLDFIVNALDNNIARQYTDSKCVLHQKPLFESGTLGTKANSAVCLPHKTPSYSEGVVAGEGQGIAKCTIRNFPAIILHCIEWAREMFDEWYVVGSDAVNAFIEDKEGFLAKAKADVMGEDQTLIMTRTWVELSQNRSAEVCVKMMFEKFVKYFNHGIRDLTNAFPKDSRNICKDTKADLGPFWHGAKIYPQVADFKPKDEMQFGFIYHGSCLLADIFKIPRPTEAEVRKICAKLKVPKWQASDVKIDLSEGDEKKDDDDEKKEAGNGDEDVKALRKALAAIDTSKMKPLMPMEFEKDDETNHHIDLIQCTTNMRAFNYHIKPATAAHCRMVAGRIIPAIATTTACITGFIQIEILKHIKGSDLNDFRAATLNLAMNVFCLENLPDPVKKKTGMDMETYMEIVAIPEGFTTWDYVVIDKPDLTMGEFLEEFTKVHHGARIDMLCGGDAMLYSEAIPSQKKKYLERCDKKLIDVYTELLGPIFPPDRKYILLDCTVEDPDGETGVVPKIRYNFA